MRTQASKDGYLLIDHRAGPGVSEETVRAAGVDAPAVPGGRYLEMKTMTCSHCKTVVVLNEKRTRERHYCRGCDHYICDVCAGIAHQTGECHDFERLADEYRNIIERGASVQHALFILRGTILNPLISRGAA